MAGHTGLFLIILLLVPAAGPAQEPESALKEALDEARLLLEEGKFKEAVKAYKKARKLEDSPSFEGAIGLATALNRVGAFSSAAKSAHEALELAQEPRDQVAAYSQIGIAAYARGTAAAEGLRNAEAALRKVLEIAPDSAPGVRFLLGVVLLKQERDEEGVAVLEDYVTRNPTGQSVELARSYVEQPLRARVPLMPEFEIVTLGGEFLTAEDLHGKVVLFDFWGTWCKPCVAAIPHLRRLSRRSSKDPFVIVGIASDSDEDLLRGFVAEHDMAWPQFMDEDREVTQETFEVSRFPTYLLVDHEGVVVYRHTGWSEAIAAEVSSQVSKAIRAAKKAAK